MIGMVSPLIRTKMLVPPLRHDLVTRPRLTELLNKVTESRLTLLSAPAGFGKTTLLTQWLQDWSAARTADLEPERRCVAWVSLDASDNDLVSFWSYPITALSAAATTAAPMVGAESLALLQSGRSPIEAVLTALVNELARQPGQVVLVLEDYHVVTDREVHDSVTFFLDHLPPDAHLVIATRADPGFPLGGLRARGELVEIRAADLRFSAEETIAYLTSPYLVSSGVTLSSEDIATLGARTEGWIAALQLAALSLRGRDDIAGFISGFSGSDRYIVDYLAEEVLDRQPDLVRRFLLATCFLDRFTGDLCDAVTGRSGSSRMLDSLARGNLFLVPLDDQRRWYRYHHLFADLLRGRLDDPDFGGVPMLHRRASDWFAEQGLPEEAVRYAVAGEDFDRAAHLIEEALPQMRRTRQDRLLLRWAQALPEPVVRRSPVLCVVAGWAAMMSGDLDAFEHLLDAAEEALAAGRADERLASTWADTEDLRTAPATVAVYRASLAQARGDIEGTAHHARNALALAGPEDHFVRGAGSGFLGLSAWAAGDIASALSRYEEAVRALHAAGNHVDELDSTIVLADLWVTSGRPSKARRLCEQSLRTAMGSEHPHQRAAADLHVALSELDLELDDLAGAETHLETARVLAESASITENRHRWFVAAAHLRAARGDHDTSMRLLDRAEELYRPGFYPDVRPIAAVRARIQVAAGDLDAAVAWADAQEVTMDDQPSYLREYEHLTLARLLLADHRERVEHGDARRRHRRLDADLEVVLDRLGRLQAAATEYGRCGSMLEIGVLQALAHDADGDLPAAIEALCRVLDRIPEPGSYRRLYLDEGSPMSAFLGRALGAAGSGAGGVRLEPVRRLARVLRTPAHPFTPAVLSRRELQVLRMLESELTGPEIARELYVTLNTLRTHTKRIYTKLDVTTRAAAVQRGRERGLL